KVFAWKRNRIATVRWRHSIAFLNLILPPTGRRSFFGFTKPDLTRRDYWRSNKNGKQQRRFTKNWWRPMDRAARRPMRDLANCVWSIFSGNNGRKIDCDCHFVVPRNAAYSRYENTIQAVWPGWLDGTMRRRAYRAGVLRIGTC